MFDLEELGGSQYGWRVAPRQVVDGSDNLPCTALGDEESLHAGELCFPKHTFVHGRKLLQDDEESCVGRINRVLWHWRAAPRHSPGWTLREH